MYYHQTEERVHFTKELEMMECNEKDTLQLACAVSKYKAEVTWYRDDVELTSGVHYKLNGSDGERVLTIINSQLSDTGDYRCTINCSDAVTKAKLLVKGRNKTTLFKILVLANAKLHKI